MFYCATIYLASSSSILIFFSDFMKGKNILIASCESRAKQLDYIPEKPSFSFLKALTPRLIGFNLPLNLNKYIYIYLANHTICI